jgi:cytochrome c-type biogenesis protein
MEQLLETLSHAVRGSTPVAVLAAFVWGVLSIVLSCCHLASIPLIVGFINGQGRMSMRRAFLIATLFAAGILVSIAAIGTVTLAAGRLMGDVGAWGYYAVAAVLFFAGLHMLDVIPIPWSGPGQVGMKRRGPLAALVLGLVFGVALGPCTFAFMAPVLSLVLKEAAARPVYAALLLAAYAVGHCSVIVLAGTFTRAVQAYLNWNEASRGAIVLRRVCGVLVILGGLFLIRLAP